MVKTRIIRRPMTKISPDLEVALDQAAANTEPLVVAYQLRGARGELIPRADEMDALVAKVVQDATQETNANPERQNILRNVGSFIIKGKANLHRALIARPEIKAAILSRSGEPPVRLPVRRRGMARKEDWVRTG